MGACPSRKHSLDPGDGLFVCLSVGLFLYLSVFSVHLSIFAFVNSRMQVQEEIRILAEEAIRSFLFYFFP
jgi:hypothetical protein